MSNKTDICHGRHCFFILHVHLVFVTKYRRQVFGHDALQRLRQVFDNICIDFEAQLIEREGETEPVQLLLNDPPKIAISTLVNSLKGGSSRILRRDRPDIAERYYYQQVLWSPSYFASRCGGAPLEIIRQYIEQQQRPPCRAAL